MKDFFIYGKHPIFLALKNKSRIFKKIYTSNFNELKKFLEDNKIVLKNDVIKSLNNAEISKIIKEDVNHQGYLALVGEKKFIDFDYFLKNKCLDRNDLPRLLILDQLTDPHNIGAIIRTAVAFGVEDIITTKFNSTKDSAVIVKSSAGLSEIINIIEVVNLNNTVEELKDVGYFVVGMAGEGKQNLKNIKDPKNLCLIIGNEGKGIRNLLKKNCDILCKIEIDEKVESLNASVATAIALFQLWG